MVQSNNDLEEFPKWIMIVVLLFFGAFILVPVGIAAPPDAFIIVAAVFIPLIGIAMIFVIFMGKNKTVQKRKLRLRKYCKWCKKHTFHKEVK